MSSNTFFYTFRTNSLKKEMEEVLGQNIYVLDRPAKDFDGLLEAVKSSGAEYVLGIALTKGRSRFEEVAFNRIGKGRVEKDSDTKEVHLYVSHAGVRSGRGMTYGFCNYAAFKVAVNLDQKSGFLHLNAKDISRLKSMF